MYIIAGQYYSYMYIPSDVIYFLHVLRVGSKVMIVYCSEFSAETWQLCGCSSLFPDSPCTVMESMPVGEPENEAADVVPMV